MKINLLGFTPIAEARGTLLASPVEDLEKDDVEDLEKDNGN